jgi:hypothetical protein
MQTTQYFYDVKSTPDNTYRTVFQETYIAICCDFYIKTKADLIDKSVLFDEWNDSTEDERDEQIDVNGVSGTMKTSEIVKKHIEVSNFDSLKHVI